jgi:hypothetical protein
MIYLSPPVQWGSDRLCGQVEFLVTDPEVPGLISTATRFSEKWWASTGSIQPCDENWEASSFFPSFLLLGTTDSPGWALASSTISLHCSWHYRQPWVSLGLLYIQSPLLLALQTALGEPWPPLQTVHIALGTTALGEPWPPLQTVSIALDTTALGEPWPPLQSVSIDLGTTDLGETWPPLQTVSIALGTTDSPGWALASSTDSPHCSRHYSPGWALASSTDSPHCSRHYSPGWALASLYRQPWVSLGLLYNQSPLLSISHLLFPSIQNWEAIWEKK